MTVQLMPIPDVQNQPDERNIPIDKVGVKGLRYPISVKDRSKTTTTYSWSYLIFS